MHPNMLFTAAAARLYSALRVLALGVPARRRLTRLPVVGQPPMRRYQERARSSFQLHNGSLFPLTVVLEVRGFKVTDEGEVVDVALDTSRVQVKLSAMSFRIPPRGSYRVFYEASGDSLPAWFNILSAMSGARTESGLNVRLLLPHVVYLNQKQPLKKRGAVRALRSTRSKKARIPLELGRTWDAFQVMDRRSTHQWAERGFPSSRPAAGPRPWDARRRPESLTVRFARFTSRPL